MKSAFLNGQVYTGEGRTVQAFLTENGIFTAAGTDAEILALAGPDAETTDLEGRFVCPGFNDSHMHLIGLGKSLAAAGLADHTDSLAGLLDPRYCIQDSVYL